MIRIKTKSLISILLLFTLNLGLLSCSLKGKKRIPQNLGIIKVNTKAGKGSCLPKLKGPASSVLKKNKINLYTGNNRRPSKGNKEGVTNRRKLSYKDGRAKAVAEVISTVASIGKGKFTAHKNLRIVFGNPGKSSKNSRRTAFDIQLNPGATNARGLGGGKAGSRYGGTNNRALIAHELGHYIGRVYYGAYFKAVRSVCKLTRYSYKNKNRNPRREEFSEVFAAYVTNPALFRNKGRHCRTAFKFFANVFGEKRINMSCESRRSAKTKSSGSKKKPVKEKNLKDYPLSKIPVPTKSPRSKKEALEKKVIKKKEESHNSFVPIPTKRPVRPEDDDFLTDEDFDEEGEVLPDSVSGAVLDFEEEYNDGTEEEYEYEYSEDVSKEKETYYNY